MKSADERGGGRGGGGTKQRYTPESLGKKKTMTKSAGFLPATGSQCPPVNLSVVHNGDGLTAHFLSHLYFCLSSNKQL